MTDPTLAFGRTRSRVAARHAFLAPDGHVPASLPGWRGAEAVTLVAPQLGTGVSARFTMTLVFLQPGASGASPLPGVERFLYVLEGALEVGQGDAHQRLEEGGYAFLPAGTQHTLAPDAPARLLLFERRYLPRAGVEAPRPVLGNVRDRPAAPFLGDERIRVQRLLPERDPALDVAINVMTYEPGASLPFVETHANEHGLLMLRGGGVYRLEEDWYPITTGDALWMGPFCPQWFGALGEEPGAYLLYKDEGRDWLAEEPR